MEGSLELEVASPLARRGDGRDAAGVERGRSLRIESMAEEALSLMPEAWAPPKDR